MVFRFLVVLAAFIFWSEAGRAATLELTRIVPLSTVSAPIHVSAPTGDEDQLFILSRNGTVHRYDRRTGTVDATPFYAGPGDVGTGGERGAFAIAFDRDFDTNGKLYLSYVNTAEEHVVVAVNTLSGNTVTPVITIPHPTDGSSNHYGGWLGVDNDNNLIVTTGDSGRLLQNPGQEASFPLLGDVLRIDPNADDFPGDADQNYGVPTGNSSGTASYADGLRNPWRAGYDAQTNTLIVTDVGQNRVEEINLGIEGADYGWPNFEGSLSFPSGSSNTPSGETFPLFEYLHETDPIDGRSITGGEIYRGEIAELDGQYFFGDFISGGIYSLTFDAVGMTLSDLTVWDILIDGFPVPATGDPITGLSSFGLDAAGNLYVMGLFGSRGGVFQVTGVSGFNAIPLPASLWLLMAALGGLFCIRQRAA